MEDKISKLYELINESKDFSGVFSNEDELRQVLSDPAKVDSFFQLFNESKDFNGVFKDVDEFSNSFQLKKKTFRKFLAKMQRFLRKLRYHRN